MELKNFYISIIGTKIHKTPSGSKTAKLSPPVEYKDAKYSHWNDAYAFADKEAKGLKDQNAWEDFHIVVIESVPNQTMVYGMHFAEVKQMLSGYFQENWESIVTNKVCIQVENRLADQNYKLLVEIVRSFIVKDCPEFVQYRKGTRKDELEDLDKAVANYIRDWNKSYQFDLDAESKEA